MYDNIQQGVLNNCDLGAMSSENARNLKCLNILILIFDTNKYYKSISYKRIYKIK